MRSPDEIEWRSPRLICVAGDFTRYDGHAVQQINRNIQLMRYRQYGDELLVLELVNSVKAEVVDFRARDILCDQNNEGQLGQADAC